MAIDMVFELFDYFVNLMKFECVEGLNEIYCTLKTGVEYK